MALDEPALPAHSETPSLILTRKEDRALLGKALARLGEGDRQVVILREFLNLSWKQISAAMRATSATLQMRQLRARKRLATILRKGGLG